MPRLFFAFSVFISVSLIACVDDAVPSSGDATASATDSGFQDVAVVDAVAADAGVADSSLDAGQTNDAARADSLVFDAQQPDTGISDAATTFPDATQLGDGSLLDAASVDAVAADAQVADATAVDAGVADSSLDAGQTNDAARADSLVFDAQQPDTSISDAATADAYVDPQCSGQPNLTPCTLTGDPDSYMNVCVNEFCVSPGCGEASCNLPQTFPLADTGQMTCYNDTAALATCPGTAGAVDCDSVAYCGQDAQYGDGSLTRFSRDVTVANEPVVSDSISGLMWQGCPAGQSGSACGLGSPATKTWSAALDYCETLNWAGHQDWRLPSRLELASIVDYSTYSPAIDQSAFPATPPSQWFWTASSVTWDVSRAWSVLSSYGNVYSNNVKTNSYPVRCARLEP